MEQPFSDPIFSDSIFDKQGTTPSLSSPQILIDELADKYTVVVAVPDGQEAELNTYLEDNQLTISGTITQSTENTLGNLFGESSAHCILSNRHFSQTMTLPANVDDESGMDMKHEDSSITITIPKRKS